MPFVSAPANGEEGYIGILVTMMFYDPEHDRHIIINFGDTRTVESAFRLLVRVLGILMPLS